MKNALVLVGVLVACAALLVLTSRGCSHGQAEQPKGEVVGQPAEATQPAQAGEAGQNEQAQETKVAQATPQPQKQAEGGRRPVGESVLQGPADYLRTVTITAPRHARKSIDAAYIQNEIKQFYALEGRYPRSLDELVQWRGEPLPETPSGYVYQYDAASGKVEVVPGE